jgi:hypothetical protein
MSIQSILFYLFGVIASLAAICILFPLRDGCMRSGRYRVLAAAVLILPAVVLAFMLARTAPVTDPLTGTELPPVGTAGNLQGDDWGMITHAFLGGPAPGTGASAAQSPAGSEATARAQLSATELEKSVKHDPRDVEAWLALGRARRIAREFPQAVTAYEAALKLDSGNADAWADYADALASASGRSLLGKPAVAVGKAIAIDPTHLKGLWLAASLSLEQHEYREALATWQRLRAALPAGSPDASIIDDNIREAKQLAGTASEPMSKPGNASSTAHIEGSVDLDAKLRKVVTQGMTLFVVAKPAQGRGPPYAVARLAVGSWPVHFTLDDSMAMLPGQNLSSVAAVMVEARVSLTGDAISHSGDPIAPAQLVQTQGAAQLMLHIAQTVP